MSSLEKEETLASLNKSLHDIARFYRITIYLLSIAGFYFNCPIIFDKVTSITQIYAYHLTPFGRFVQLVTAILSIVSLSIILIVRTPHSSPLPGACSTFARVAGVLCSAVHMGLYFSVDSEERWPLSPVFVLLAGVGAGVAGLDWMGEGDLRRTRRDIESLKWC